MATRTTKTTTTKKAPAAKKTAVKKEVEQIVLDPRVFAYPVKAELISQVLHVYRDNLHQNTSKVKTRGELEKTTKKMFKQKGTGNARHGTRMAPQFVGGGVAHGPSGIQPANLKVNQKMKSAALAGLLTIYAKDNLVELANEASLKESKVKAVKGLFGKDATLLVYAKEAPSFIAAVRNLENLCLIEANRLNAYLVAESKHVVLTPSAHEAVVNRLLPLLKAKK